MTDRAPFAPGRAAWLLVPWFGALALAGGCGDTGGAGGGGAAMATSSPSGTGGAETCGLPPFADAGCEACMTSSCCTELRACAAEPSCHDAAACALACNLDPACIASTCIQSGGPTPVGIDVDECGLKSCIDACPQYQGGCAPLQTGYGQACGTCLKTKCCDSFSPSLDDLDYQKCRLGCADPACLYACEESHPGAIAYESAEGSCFVDSCHTECANPEGCGLLSSTGDCGEPARATIGDRA